MWLIIINSQLVPKEYLEQYAKMEILMDTKVGGWGLQFFISL